MGRNFAVDRTWAVGPGARPLEEFQGKQGLNARGTLGLAIRRQWRVAVTCLIVAYFSSGGSSHGKS